MDDKEVKFRCIWEPEPGIEVYGYTDTEEVEDE
jgi:hypothetical protein